MDGVITGRWSESFQGPEMAGADRFQEWREAWRARGYRFLRAHLYQVEGFWWVDLEMERI